MNSWLKNILWLSFVVLVIVLMSFVNASKENQISGLPKVKVYQQKAHAFLTEPDIIERLKARHLIGENFSYGQIDFKAIEAYLLSLSEVKSVKVYTKTGEKWFVDVTLREPIARLFNLNGTSCYIDKSGRLMPLSPNYTAHVLTINGYVNETDMQRSAIDVINNDSLKTIEILDDLYEISNYVCSDKFFSSQITHIFVNSNGEFEMIPRVGKHRIMFGNSDHIAGKFKKLKVFYKEGLSKAGWEKYDTINVKYKNQIVCSKR